MLPAFTTIMVQAMCGSKSITTERWLQLISTGANKAALADVISVLATTCSPGYQRDSLKFRLEGSEGSVGDWGHEYVRHLGGELAAEYQVGCATKNTMGFWIGPWLTNATT